MRFSFSFGNGLKAFEYKYPFPLAIPFHIKPKHESRNFLMDPSL
jgi:hypothetical protein